MDISTLPGKAYWLGLFLEQATRADLIEKHRSKLRRAKRFGPAQEALDDALWEGFYAVSVQVKDAAQRVRDAGLLPFAHSRTTYLQQFKVSA